MTRTDDQDAIFLPATAGADGYTAEKAKGHVGTLAPQEEFRCSLAFGALEPAEAERMRAAIDAVRQTSAT